MDFVDIVNERDEVVGSRDIEAAHGAGLLHRSVHLLIMNSRGEVCLRKRPPKSKRYAGFWSLFGAHVLSGQSYDEAAKNHCRKLGVSSPPEKIAVFGVKDGVENEVTALYLVRTGEKPAEGNFFSVNEAKLVLKREKTTPYVRLALDELKKQKIL